METPKGYAIEIMRRFCEKLDGFLTFSFHFNLEVIQYLLDQEKFVVEQSQEFISEYKEKGCAFFGLNDDDKQSLCMFNLCLLHKQIRGRGDLK